MDCDIKLHYQVQQLTDATRLLAQNFADHKHTSTLAGYEVAGMLAHLTRTSDSIDRTLTSINATIECIKSIAVTAGFAGVGAFLGLFLGRL